ncbi:unnamed protein product [Rangifer tarandus platyrhynchus]|uniref:Uncharacterized protein n=2 Tax=Rangifer tarandus platyrhynchus TaxID=3082113 RepID=A0ABN8ZLD3_RANTA|nr:unnamed protein product [Rangifer tarandus platyrhynchus]CAI9708273.1 unnamed protein product [Rangifer tarandus platyrhynchus]
MMSGDSFRGLREARWRTGDACVGKAVLWAEVQEATALSSAHTPAHSRRASLQLVTVLHPGILPGPIREFLILTAAGSHLEEGEDTPLCLSGQQHVAAATALEVEEVFSCGRSYSDFYQKGSMAGTEMERERGSREDRDAHQLRLRGSELAFCLGEGGSEEHFETPGPAARAQRGDGCEEARVSREEEARLNDKDPGRHVERLRPSAPATAA